MAALALHPACQGNDDEEHDALSPVDVLDLWRRTCPGHPDPSAAQLEAFSARALAFVAAMATMVARQVDPDGNRVVLLDHVLAVAHDDGAVQGIDRLIDGVVGPEDPDDPDVSDAPIDDGMETESEDDDF